MKYLFSLVLFGLFSATVNAEPNGKESSENIILAFKQKQAECVAAETKQLKAVCFRELRILVPAYQAAKRSVAASS